MIVPSCTGKYAVVAGNEEGLPETLVQATLLADDALPFNEPLN